VISDLTYCKTSIYVLLLGSRTKMEAKLDEKLKKNREAKK
jgi:hypothetical protein